MATKLYGFSVRPNQTKRYAVASPVAPVLTSRKTYSLWVENRVVLTKEYPFLLPFYSLRKTNVEETIRARRRDREFQITLSDRETSESRSRIFGGQISNLARSEGGRGNQLIVLDESENGTGPQREWVAPIVKMERATTNSIIASLMDGLKESIRSDTREAMTIIPIATSRLNQVDTIRNEIDSIYRLVEHEIDEPSTTEVADKLRPLVTIHEETNDKPIKRFKEHDTHESIMGGMNMTSIPVYEHTITSGPLVPSIYPTSETDYFISDKGQGGGEVTLTTGGRAGLIPDTIDTKIDHLSDSMPVREIIDLQIDGSDKAKSLDRVLDVQREGKDAMERVPVIEAAKMEQQSTVTLLVETVDSILDLQWLAGLTIDEIETYIDPLQKSLYVHPVVESIADGVDAAGYANITSEASENNLMVGTRERAWDVYRDDFMDRIVRVTMQNDAILDHAVGRSRYDTFEVSEVLYDRMSVRNVFSADPIEDSLRAVRSAVEDVRIMTTLPVERSIPEMLLSVEVMVGGVIPSKEKKKIWLIPARGNHWNPFSHWKKTR